MRETGKKRFDKDLDLLKKNMLVVLKKNKQKTEQHT